MIDKLGMLFENLKLSNFMSLAVNSKAQGYLAIFGCTFGLYQFFASGSQERVLNEQIVRLETQLTAANETVERLSDVAIDIHTNQTALLRRKIEAANLSAQAPIKIEDLSIFADLNFNRGGVEYFVKDAVLFERERFFLALMSYTEGDWGMMGTSERIYFAIVEGSEATFLPQNLFADRSRFRIDIKDETIRLVVDETGLQPTPVPRQVWGCNFHFDNNEDSLVFDEAYSYGSQYLISGPCFIYSDDGENKTKLSDFIYSEVVEHYLDRVKWSDKAGGYVSR